MKSSWIIKWIVGAVGVWMVVADKANQSTLVAYAGLLLLAFWDDLAEFDFLGLKGKRIEKKLEDLAKTVNKDDKPINEDMLTKLRKQKVQLLGVDKSNLLALVFEIERLLRIIGQGFGAKEDWNFEQIVQRLHDEDYLTDAGQDQLEALNEVRDLIIQSGMEEKEILKLEDWLTLAYEIYKELSEDLKV